MEMTHTKMRPIRETISLAAAMAILDSSIEPISRTEVITLDDSDERVLATRVVATTDVPPFNRAAMDGFAVIADDTLHASQENPIILKCIETVHTGSVPTKSVGHGECIEIATGAPMPVGADAVVMVEATTSGLDNSASIFLPAYSGQHVGRRGADITSGQLVLESGSHLTPSRIGSIAALGVAEIEAFARPEIAILSTGNEIVEPGKPLGLGQIYDINRFTLGAVITKHGGVAINYPTAADTLASLEAVVDICLDKDAIVFSGGSSVGERDLTLDVLERKGEVLFHGIAIKPGKPTLFGRIGRVPVLGMPGYPTSCLSNAYVFLIPLIRKLSRLPLHHMRAVSMPAAERFISTIGRHQFYTVQVVDGTAVPAFKGSGNITSMSQADGYIEIAASVGIVEKGQIVEVKFF
jgi:molybdopterin molybdotransferase